MNSGRGSQASALKPIALHSLLLAAVAIWLSGCQSGGDAIEALDPKGLAAEAASVAAPQLAGNQSLGTGAVQVAMLLPLSAQGSLGDRAKQMRDAAVLAMNDMGGNLITLTIMDTGGQDSRAKHLAQEAMSSGAAAILGPVEERASRQLAAISGAKRAPVLSLADNFVGGGSAVYGVALNEPDSAAAGAAAVARMGARKFVLVAPEGAVGNRVEQRVANAVANVGGSLAVTLRFGPTTASPLKVAAELASLVDQPDAIVIAVDRTNPLQLVKALRERGLVKEATRVVGTHRWLDHPFSDPAFDGILVASLDSDEGGLVRQRFKQAYGRDADDDAAYAYDVVALASGLVGALGTNGFTPAVLQAPSGFRGSTGVFRFRSDGSSERSVPLYRIENGQLNVVAKAVRPS